MGLVLVVGASTAGVAMAATSPCGTAGNFHDDAITSTYPTYGAEANIVAMHPAICGSSSFGNAWSMLSAASGSGSGWAQAGYGNFYGTFEGFTQWVNKYPADNPSTKYFAAPSGAPQYVVSYNFTDGFLHLWMNTTQLTQTNFDPAVYWTAPCYASFSGETGHKQSDVPGTLSSPVTFSQMKTMDRNYNWSSNSGLALNSEYPTRYQNAWVSKPSSFKIWTYPLN